MHNFGQPHLHRRIGGRSVAPDARPNLIKKYADRVVYAAGILHPIMTIPQIYAVWSSQNPAGVSLVSWCFYLLGAAAWTVYGIIHHEKPIIFANASLVLVNSLVVLGVLLYR